MLLAGFECSVGLWPLGFSSYMLIIVLWPKWFQEGSVSEREHSAPRHPISFWVGTKWSVLLFKEKKTTELKPQPPRGACRAHVFWGAFSLLWLQMQAVAFVRVVAHRQLRSAKHWNPTRSHLFILLLWDWDFWLVSMSIAGNGCTKTAAATEEWVLLPCPTDPFHYVVFPSQSWSTSALLSFNWH